MTTPLTVFERWTDADGVPLFADRKWPHAMTYWQQAGCWYDYLRGRLCCDHAEDSCIAAAVGELLAAQWDLWCRDGHHVACDGLLELEQHRSLPATLSTALARLNGRTPREVAP